MSAKDKKKGKQEAKPEGKPEPRKEEPAPTEFRCPECEDHFPTKASFRAHMLSAHIVANREKYGDTVLAILKEHKGAVERDELMVLCHERNPSMSKLGEKAYTDPINELKKQGKVHIRTIVELVEE